VLVIHWNFLVSLYFVIFSPFKNYIHILYVSRRFEQTAHRLDYCKLTHFLLSFLAPTVNQRETSGKIVAWGAALDSIRCAAFFGAH